jgi:tetratricopeptide (TPR) repeat protein
MTRRFFAKSFGVCMGMSLLSSASVAFGYLTQDQQASSATEDEYTQAVYLLRRGRQFEQCIRLLHEAIQKKPNSALYHSALGCAYTSRAVSVGIAASRLSAYAENGKIYRYIVSVWEKATGQKVPPPKSLPPDTPDTSSESKNALSALSPEMQEKVIAQAQTVMTEWLSEFEQQKFSPDKPPLPPPILVTKDDSKPFQMTMEEAQTAFAKLADDAIHAFDNAKRLTASESPEIQAEREWNRACALRLLERQARQVKVTLPLRSDDITAAFDAVIELAPNTAVYWQSRGDYLLKSGEFRRGLVSLEKMHQALDSYRKSLRIQPKNPALALHMLRTYLAFGKEPPRIGPDAVPIVTNVPPAPEPTLSPDETAEILRLVQKSDSANAYLLYFAAALRLKTATDFQSTSFREATELLAKARNAPTFRPVVYRETMPRLLHIAWGWSLYDAEIIASWPMEWSSMSSRLLALAKAEVEKPDGDSKGALAAVRDLLPIAQHIAAYLPKNSAMWNTAERGFDMLAYEIVNSTYKGMISLLHHMGDTNGEAACRQEYTTVFAPYKERNRAAVKSAFLRYTPL